MNSSTYKIIRAALSADESVSPDQTRTVLSLLGNRPLPQPAASLLLTQRKAAQLLGVSRITIWRLVKENVIHPVRIRDSLMYRRAEIEKLASDGHCGQVIA